MPVALMFIAGGAKSTVLSAARTELAPGQRVPKWEAHLPGAERCICSRAVSPVRSIIHATQRWTGAALVGRSKSRQSPPSARAILSSRHANTRALPDVLGWDCCCAWSGSGGDEGSAAGSAACCGLSVPCSTRRVAATCMPTCFRPDRMKSTLHHANCALSTVRSE